MAGRTVLEADKKDRMRRRLNAVLYVALFFVLFICYGLYHRVISISSDTTTTLPMAADLLKGNFLLRKWVLGSNNFYFTEIWVYAIGMLLGFSDEVLIGWVPALAMAFILVGTLRLLDIDLVPERVTVGFVTFWILFAGISAVIPYTVGYTLLNANSHNNLYAFVILDLLIIRRFFRTGHRRWLAAAGVFGILLSFSEGVTSMVLFAPLGLLSVWKLIRERDRRYIPVIAVILINYAGGKILQKLFDLADGMVVDSMAVHLTSPSAWGARIKGFITCIGRLFGCPDYFGLAFGFEKIIYTAVLAAFVVMLAAGLILLLMNRLTALEQLVYLIVFVNLGASVVTDVVVFERYVVPAQLFGVILGSKMFGHFLDHRMAVSERAGVRRGAFCLAAAAAFFSVGICADKAVVIRQAPVYGREQKEVVKFLEDKGLRNGYADFMLASQFSFYSDFKENIQPASLDQHATFIQPHTELIRQGCYRQKNVNFILTYADSRSSAFDMTRLQKYTGEPTETYSINGYAIYYWKNQDLSDYLNNALEDGKISNEEFSLSKGASLDVDGVIAMQQNGITYGPDAYLEEGSYRVTYKGENLESCDYDVHSDSFGNYTIVPVEETDDLLIYDVEIDHRANNIQFRVHNKDKAAAYIDSFEIADAE